eukprot:scaffold300_cov258-Pinguiococcus_pyrenoidosus.AAC.62
MVQLAPMPATPRRSHQTPTGVYMSSVENRANRTFPDRNLRAFVAEILPHVASGPRQSGAEVVLAHIGKPVAQLANCEWTVHYLGPNHTCCLGQSGPATDWGKWRDARTHRRRRELRSYCIGQSPARADRR